jgi:hypothetical protein
VREFGIDIARLKPRIYLIPGDLLIFDNLRNVQCRLGRRASLEICQMRFGLPYTDAELLGRVRNHVASAPEPGLP